MSCETEMHIHYVLEAKEYLDLALSTLDVQEAFTFAAKGLIALDGAEACGAPKESLSDLEGKLLESVWGPVFNENSERQS